MRAPSKGKTKQPFNKKHRVFTEKWLELGSAVKAAEAAGFSHHYAADLCQHAGVLKYKAELEKKATDKAVARLAVTKEMWLAHLWELSHIPPEVTNNNITGQVKAAEAYGGGAGFKVELTADLTKLIAGRSEDEQDFFIQYNKWPEEDQPAWRDFLAARGK